MEGEKQCCGFGDIFEKCVSPTCLYIHEIWSETHDFNKNKDGTNKPGYMRSGMGVRELEGVCIKNTFKCFYYLLDCLKKTYCFRPSFAETKGLLYIFLIV